MAFVLCLLVIQSSKGNEVEASLCQPTRNKGVVCHKSRLALPLKALPFLLFTEMTKSQTPKDQFPVLSADPKGSGPVLSARRSQLDATLRRLLSGREIKFR
jgi:hypothetical protein